MAAAKEWSTRREELTKLAEQTFPAGRLNTAGRQEDLETPLEVVARAAGLTKAELRRAASHPYDPEGYLVTMTLLAEDEAATHGGTAGAQPTRRKGPDGQPAQGRAARVGESRLCRAHATGVVGGGESAGAAQGARAPV